MSAVEHEGPQVEQRSSVKISTTAKLDALIEVKAYTNDLDQLDAARVAAVAAYKQTLADLGVGKQRAASTPYAATVVS